MKLWLPMLRRTNSAAVAAAALLAVSTLGAAQSTTRWTFMATPYAWLAGLDGQVGVGPLAANVDFSFSDVLKALRFAAMGYGEARLGPHIFGVDVIYISLGHGDVVAFRGATGGYELTLRETILQPIAGYAIGTDSRGVDLLGGV